MPARTKLNTAYFHGSMIVAALLGGASGSWLIFGVALIALLLGNLLAGEIRPKAR